MAESKLHGVKDLQSKLEKLDSAVAAKALRQAAMLATTPAVREMRAAAPVGQEAHRTYKGRLVAPGFLSRSIKRTSRLRNGVATVLIGVRREAFYGLHFIELGTKYISAQPWFTLVFERNKNTMLRRFREQLRRKIDRARQ